jgi:hypothetical protein
MLDTHEADALFDQLPVAIERFKRKSRKLCSPSPSMTLTCTAWDAQQYRPRIFVRGDALEGFGMQPNEPCKAPGYFFGLASNEHRQALGPRLALRP